MATMRDCRFEALRTQGFTGATSDMLEQWLIANGGVRGDANGNLFRSMLISQGVAPAHVKDMWYEFLGSKGHTGALRDRELQFWCAGGNIEPPRVCNQLVAADLTATVRGFNPSNGSLTPTDIDGFDVFAFEVNVSSGFIRITLTGSLTPFVSIGIEYQGDVYVIPEAGTRYQLTDVPLTQQLYDAMAPFVGISSEICFDGNLPPRLLVNNERNALTDDSGNVLQHDDISEDEMLYTDYMPERSDSANNYVVTGTPTEVAAISEVLPNGKYHLTASMVATFTSSAGSMTAGFDLNGVLSSFKIAPDTDQVSEPVAWSYTFPYEVTAGQLDFSVELSEADTGSITVQVINLVAKRVS